MSQYPCLFVATLFATSLLATQLEARGLGSDLASERAPQEPELPPSSRSCDLATVQWGHIPFASQTTLGQIDGFITPSFTFRRRAGPNQRPQIEFTERGLVGFRTPVEELVRSKLEEAIHNSIPSSCESVRGRTTAAIQSLVPLTYATRTTSTLRKCAYILGGEIVLSDIANVALASEIRMKVDVKDESTVAIQPAIASMRPSIELKPGASIGNPLEGIVTTVVGVILTSMGAGLTGGANEVLNGTRWWVEIPRAEFGYLPALKAAEWTRSDTYDRPPDARPLGIAYMRNLTLLEGTGCLVAECLRRSRDATENSKCVLGSLSAKK